MRTQFTRAEITDLLLKNGYKPVITKESDIYDIYEKVGSSKVRLLTTSKVFQRSLLNHVLPTDLLNFL